MYKETQHFRQPWLWLLLLGSLALVIYRWQPIHVGIMAGIMGLFWFLRLETRIDPEGIAYRWFPFQSTYRVIKWSQIEQVTVRSYSALGEFGGWGIRFSWNGTAHTVSGNWGIDIKLKGKKRTLLVGTRHPDEIRQQIGNEQLVGN
ncbi:hypothetical protein ACS5NO_08030 [Larkinella sp. GY13]|uniref:hypothetical protein n=1 Tax=Larkinella sp. GY13 TaxID=3453720 RepID=UPI003EEB2FDA